MEIKIKRPPDTAAVLDKATVCIERIAALEASDVFKVEALKVLEVLLITPPISVGQLYTMEVEDGSGDTEVELVH